MLSTVPTFFSPGSMLDNDPFPAFESGFTPWDCSELFSSSQSIGTGTLGSGSVEPNQNQNQTKLISGLDESNSNSNQLVPVIDERKRRRMISNRESARRSRMRKQKHLENLRNQVNRLRVQNTELTNRLRFVLYHCHRIGTDNDRLRFEHSILRGKLSDINQLLLLKQLQQISPAWPCNNNNVSNAMSEQIRPLIT